MDEPFAPPKLDGEPDAEGWVEEKLVYRVTPEPKPKFNTVLDARKVFGDGNGTVSVVTRVRATAAEGEPVVALEVTLKVGGVHMVDQLECVNRGGVVADKLLRVVGDARRKEIDFGKSPFALPDSTYPEVLIPFLMRGQRFQKKRRALYAWTSDRFVARVYYESRKEKTFDVPGEGAVRATEVWMYPDMNDWVKIGNVLTKLIKPFLPRYAMWFETARPHRPVRFEGAFGPPGAPEVILELQS